ncbi:MAG: hypothetical protein ACXWBN_00310 [Acidimicrobiales bacterium]
MEQERPNPEHSDADIRRSVHQARQDGADTEGLEGALADSEDSLAETRDMADEAAGHIEDACRQVDMDAEMTPERGRHLYESGSEGGELDDQSIAPPG